MPTIKKRILCAEPHEDICRLLTLLLEQQGHEVKSAPTISDCLELAASEQFDLFLLNDRYIDGDGLALCRQLRRRHGEVPILFFTSAAFLKDRQQGMEAGASAYLTKPGDVVEVVQTINALLEPRKVDTRAGGR